MGKRKNLSILVYYHGGGFCIESTSSQSYHGYVNALVAAAQIVVVSVDYILALEHPLPSAYDDSWSTLKWIVFGPEDWLNEFVDFGKIYLAEDSAGANIAHHIAMRNREDKLIDLVGIVFVDPYFVGTGLTVDELKDEELWRVAGGLWMMANSGSVGELDDPEINVTVDPKLPWHVFHLFNMAAESAAARLKRTILFLNQGRN
ncbi:Probable carboxylesterase 7 [Linum perenne]